MDFPHTPQGAAIGPRYACGVMQCDGCNRRRRAMGDSKPVEITPTLCRAARVLADMTQGELAEAAGLSINSIQLFEAGKRSPYASSLAAIRKALELAGCQFIPENGGGEGVRFRKPKAKRRARK